MNTEINLLPQRKGNLLTNQQVIVRIRIAALLCVMVTICLSIGVFLLNQVNSPERMKEQEDALSKTVLQSKNKAFKQLALIDRLNHIQTIINNRASLQNNIVLVQDLVPDNVSIQTFTLDNKEFTISVLSTELGQIDTFLTNMTDLLHSKKFMKKMTVEDVVADQKTGKYSLSINGTL